MPRATFLFVVAAVLGLLLCPYRCGGAVAAPAAGDDCCGDCEPASDSPTSSLPAPESDSPAADPCPCICTGAVKSEAAPTLAGGDGDTAVECPLAPLPLVPAAAPVAALSIADRDDGAGDHPHRKRIALRVLRI